jgi:hypothetical protein
MPATITPITSNFSELGMYHIALSEIDSSAVLAHYLQSQQNKKRKTTPMRNSHEVRPV